MYMVHWAVIENDGKNHLGWFAEEFSTADEALAFAATKRASGASVISFDSHHNRID